MIHQSTTSRCGAFTNCAVGAVQVTLQGAQGPGKWKFEKSEEAEAQGGF